MTVPIQVIYSPKDLSPTTSATNIVAVQANFISPSSISVSQEATGADIATETLANIVGNTDDGDIYPPLVTMVDLGNREEDTSPSTGCEALTSFSKNSWIFCEKMLYFGQW